MKKKQILKNIKNFIDTEKDHSKRFTFLKNLGVDKNAIIIMGGPTSKIYKSNIIDFMKKNPEMFVICAKKCANIFSEFCDFSIYYEPIEINNNSIKCRIFDYNSSDEYIKDDNNSDLKLKVLEFKENDYSREKAYWIYNCIIHNKEIFSLENLYSKYDYCETLYAGDTINDLGFRIPIILNCKNIYLIGQDQSYAGINSVSGNYDYTKMDLNLLKNDILLTKKHYQNFEKYVNNYTQYLYVKHKLIFSKEENLKYKGNINNENIDTTIFYLIIFYSSKYLCNYFKNFYNINLIHINDLSSVYFENSCSIFSLL